MTGSRVLPDHDAQREDLARGRLVLLTGLAVIAAIWLAVWAFT